MNNLHNTKRPTVVAPEITLIELMLAAAGWILLFPIAGIADRIRSFFQQKL